MTSKRTRLSYDQVSQLLATGTAIAYVIAFLVLSGWRQSIFEAKECAGQMSSPTPAPWCLEARGWQGWLTGAALATPLTCIAMLVVIGLVYWLLGKRLDLTSYGERRDVMLVLLQVTAAVGGLILLSAGAGALYFG